jgi:hypothetical protein
VDYFNPVEWFSELYGRAGHIGFVVPASIISVALAILWSKGAEKWKSEHVPLPIIAIDHETIRNNEVRALDLIVTNNGPNGELRVQCRILKQVGGGKPRLSAYSMWWLNTAADPEYKTIQHGASDRLRFADGVIGDLAIKAFQGGRVDDFSNVYWGPLEAPPIWDIELKVFQKGIEFPFTKRYRISINKDADNEFVIAELAPQAITPL